MKPLASPARSYPWAPRSFFRLARAASLAAVLLVAPCLHAANVTWSSAGTSTPGGDGNWTGGSTWWNGSSAVTWTASDNATFSAAGNTTVNSSVTVGSITFTSSSANISILGGAGDITLNSGITATNSANTTARTFTISESVALGANQTWTVNAGGTVGTADLAVSGIISGSNLGITKAGNGTLSLSGVNTYTGNTTINSNSGTLQITGAGQLGGGSYSGNISIGSGSGFLYNSSANQTLSGVISGGGGFNKWGSSASTLTLSGNNTLSGGFVLGHNVLNLTGGNVILMHNKALGTGALTWENDGTVELGTNGLTISNNNNIYSRSSATDGKRRYRLDLAGSNTGTLSGTWDMRMAATVFDVGTDDTLTASGNFSTGNGAGGFEKTGAGTLVLTMAANTASGTTVISAGTLQVGNGGTTGTLSTNATSKAVTNNAILVFKRSDALTVSNVISGTGSLIQNGTSTLTLNATNTYTGSTTINSGTLATSAANKIADTSDIVVNSGGVFSLGGAETVASISGAGNITLGANTLTTNSSSSTTFSGVISGTGGLTKNGTGTLTLSNTNTYNGSTTINAGTLQIDGNIASSALVLNSGATISPGTSAAADSFGTSSISINGGGYNWTLSSANGSAGTGYDQITSTGALTSSGLLTVYAYGTPGDWDNAANYSWDIFSANSVTGFSTGNFALNLANFNSGVTPAGTFAFSNPSGGIIRLTYTAATGPVWAGGTGNWTAGFTPAVTDGANIAFAGASGGTATNNIPTGNLTTVGDIEFRNTAGAYTLAADAGSAGASGGTALTVNGSITNNSTATQTLNTDLAFAATRTINANTGNITIGGAISGAGGLTKNGSNLLTLSGNITYSGTTTINAGSIEIGAAGQLGAGTYAGNFANDGTLIYSGTSAQTLSGIISGTGALTQNAASTLTLTGNNTYSGATTINAGTLQITGAAQLGGGSYSGNISIGNSSYFTFNSTADQTFSGRLSGSGELRKGGSGILTLSGNNTMTNGVYMGMVVGSTITGGTVRLAHNNAIGTGSIVWYNDGTIELAQSGLTIAAGTTYIYNQASATDGKRRYRLDLAGSNTGAFSGGFDVRMSGLVFDVGTDDTLTLTGNIYNAAGAGGFIKTGDGTLVLTGSTISYNGTTTISAGTLQIGAGGTTGSLTTNNNAVTNNGTLVFNRSNALTVANAISGTGNLIKEASNTLTLNASNSYTGGTTINAGTISMSHANALGTSGNITFGGGGLQYGSAITTDISSRIKNSGSAILIDTNSNNVTFASAVDSTNSGGLTKNGTGTLTLSGNNTYTGTTTISVGTLEIGAAGRLGAGSYSGNITNSGTFIYSGTNNQTLSGVISGAGAMTKDGTGTLTLSGNNSYTGITTINSGILRIMNSNALGSSSRVDLIGTETGTVLEFGSDGLDLSQAIRASNSGASRSIRLDLDGTNTGTISSSIDIRLVAAGNFQIDVGVNDTLTAAGTIYTGSAGGAGITKTGLGTLVLTGATNTASGTTTISAGTIQIGNGGTTGTLNSSGVTNNGTLVFNRSDNITVSNTISGTGALTKNGSGTLTLAGNNNYSGNTTINTGTVVIGHANAAGTGKIFQTDATSLLKFDTTGTITNAMSVYNVLATQSATLSGAITVNNASWDIETGDTLTISGAISGNGGVTKNGGGTLVLSGNNTYLAPTVINAGTLNAASANALGSNNTVQVNGGTLLVSADDAINGMNITLNGTSTTVATLSFTANYSGTINSLTLNQDSIIDLGGVDILALEIAIIEMSTHTLSFKNWTGTTLWGGGNGSDTDRIYFGGGNYTLANVHFYSGTNSDSFLGTGFDLGLQTDGFDPGIGGHHIIPVPEPESWATGLLLVLGGSVWFWRKRRNVTVELTESEGRASAPPGAEGHTRSAMI